MRKPGLLSLVLSGFLLAGCGATALPLEHTETVPSTQTANGTGTQTLIDWAFTQTMQHTEKKRWRT